MVVRSPIRSAPRMASGLWRPTVAPAAGSSVGEPLVAGVVGVRAIGGAEAVDDDIVIVRIGRIRRTVRVQPQRFALEHPALAPIERDRRDGRFLLVARAG